MEERTTRDIVFELVEQYRELDRSLSLIGTLDDGDPYLAWDWNDSAGQKVKSLKKELYEVLKKELQETEEQ